MAKAIIKTTPTGIYVRVGWDDDGSSTAEERDLATKLGCVLNEYVKKMNNAKEITQRRKPMEDKGEIRRVCPICGRAFMTKNRARRYCDDPSCEEEVYKRKLNKQKARYRRKHGKSFEQVHK